MSSYPRILESNQFFERNLGLGLNLENYRIDIRLRNFFTKFWEFDNSHSRTFRYRRVKPKIARDGWRWTSVWSVRLKVHSSLTRTLADFHFSYNTQNKIEINFRGQESFLVQKIEIPSCFYASLTNFLSIFKEIGQKNKKRSLYR